MRNIKTNNKLKMLAMVMALSIPMAATAQGGLFQRGDEPAGPRSSGAAALTNQTFGTPLGSGFITLLMASAGYAALKSNKRNKKSKKENIK